MFSYRNIPKKIVVWILQDKRTIYRFTTVDSKKRMATKKTWGISGTKLPISDNYSAYIKIDSKSILEYLRNKIIIIPDFQRDLDEEKNSTNSIGIHLSK